MKRYVQIAGLILLAIMAGGWGSVVAAAFCPHLNAVATGTSVPSSSVTEQACHQPKPAAEPKPHCHDSDMGQEAVDGMEEAAPAGSTGAGAWLGINEDALCTHCMGRSELPASSAVARQQPEGRRSFQPLLAQNPSPFVQALSVARTAVLYRQGAPPGSLPPKHLLIGVLLI